ncbi:T4 family baseplate hub assembly chaperone [Pseudomonas sp. GNP014]
MALPKLTTPEYTLVVPSTGKEIKYRPFLVKEKVLLSNLEGEDEKQINNAVMNLVKECTFRILVI